MILVTGSTGNNGVEILKRLNSRRTQSIAPLQIRAMVRKPLPAEQQLGGIDYVLADFDDPASIKEALTGVTRAFLVTNSSEQVQSQQLSFVEQAKAAGVRHIVYLSQLHAGLNSPLRFLRYHAVVEQAIQAAGITFTNLRPNLYMQGILQLAAATLASQGRIYAPMQEEAKISIVDVRDLATVAAIALTEEGHENQTYDLTGPESLTFPEIAAQLSQALARPVEFASIPEQLFRETLAKFHVPDWQAEGLIEDFAHYRRNEAQDLSPAIQQITGQPPRPFSQFAHDHKEAFLAS